MKISDKPTAHILIKASTNSEWDCCDFAIIHLSEEWRKLQEKRIEAVKPFGDDYSFQSMRFYDGSVDFFQSKDEGPDVEELLADKQWVFVELGNGELDELTSPENRLDFYKIVSKKAKKVLEFHSVIPVIVGGMITDFQYILLDMEKKIKIIKQLDLEQRLLKTWKITI